VINGITLWYLTSSDWVTMHHWSLRGCQLWWSINFLPFSSYQSIWPALSRCQVQ
jgi:hypothetical protein